MAWMGDDPLTGDVPHRDLVDEEDEEQAAQLAPQYGVAPQLAWEAGAAAPQAPTVVRAGGRLCGLLCAIDRPLATHCAVARAAPAMRAVAATRQPCSLRPPPSSPRTRQPLFPSHPACLCLRPSWWARPPACCWTPSSRARRCGRPGDGPLCSKACRCPLLPPLRSAAVRRRRAAAPGAAAFNAALPAQPTRETPRTLQPSCSCAGGGPHHRA